MGWTHPDEIRKALTVECGYCRAAIGALCTDGFRLFKTYVHAVRREKSGVTAAREAAYISELKAAGITHQVEFEIVPTEEASGRGVDTHYYTLDLENPATTPYELEQLAQLCVKVIRDRGGSVAESTFKVVKL